MVVGIVGVGAIGEAIVTGLCEGADADGSVHLSPRGTERVRRLAARYPSVQVGDTNQAVVERADVVLVCVRPQDAPPVLSELDFRAGQAVISVVAALPMWRRPRISSARSRFPPSLRERASPRSTLGTTSLARSSSHSVA
jgi:pyrroline-5-carboxylate reductase